MALGRTVDELLDGVSSSELSEYVALRALEPLPNERLEILLATLIAVTINVHRDEDTDAVDPMQFLPWLASEGDDDPAQRRVGDMVATIEGLNAAFGGRDLRPEIRDRRSETGDLRPEDGDRRPETGDQRPESGEWRAESGDLRPEI